MKDSFQDFLRALLKEHGWTYAELGGLIGVSHGAIGGWVRGTAKPDPKYLRELADLSGRDPVELFVMVGYLPEQTEKKEPMRQKLASLIAKLQNMEDVYLDMFAHQADFVVPVLRKGGADDEKKKDSERVVKRKDSRTGGEVHGGD